MDFNKFIADEMSKYKGVCFPVKSGVLPRMFVHSMRCTKMHPNPIDEFCKPEIGPSYRIISEYEEKIRHYFKHPHEELFDGEPVVVEKMHPEDYIIINGHHRWAAAIRMGMKKIPVKIVNLTHEEDIKRMIEKGKNDKRVTFDLDEVILGFTDEGELEKTLPFPLNKEYKERIRKGVPALFHFLSEHDYDIWVFTSKFYSMDYLRNLFRKYHVHIDGLVTGTAKKTSINEAGKKDIDKMLADKYKSTLHVDNDMIIQSYSDKSIEFKEFEINKEKGKWSDVVMGIVDGIDHDEHDRLQI